MRPPVAIFAWTVLAAIFVFTDVPVFLRPETGLPPTLERFIGLFVVGLAFSIAYPRRGFQVLGLLVLSVSIFEYFQHFIHNRHGTFHDVIVKCCGAFVGVMLGRLMNSLLVKSASPVP